MNQKEIIQTSPMDLIILMLRICYPVLLMQVFLHLSINPRVILTDLL